MSTNSAGVTISTAINHAGTGGVQDVVFGGPGDITVSAAITGVNNAGGIYINGPGTVTLDGAMTVSNKGIVVMGGTAKLGANFTQSSDRMFQVASGATLDMNGVSVANVQGIVERNIGGSNGSNSSSTNAGTITNTSGTTSTLTITRGNSASAQYSNSSITGNINLVLNAGSASATAQTLTGQSTYTGSTTVSSGTLILGTTTTNPVAGSILPAGTVLTIDGGGVAASLLSLVSVNQTVGGLAGNSTGGGGTINSTTASVGGVLTVNGGAGANFGGVLSGAAAGTLSFVKTGAGTQTLSGANTYTGTTVVNGGTLAVNGTHNGGAAYSVYTGGTLGGTGTINAPVSIIGGTLAPGNSVGTLNLGSSLTLNPASTLAAQYNSDVATADLVNVNGNLSLSLANDAVLSLSDLGSTVLAPLTKLTLVSYAGTWNGGTFAGKADDSVLTVGANSFTINYNDTSGSGLYSNYVTLTSAVPEASSLLMVGMVGVAGLVVRRFRTRKPEAESSQIA